MAQAIGRVGRNGSPSIVTFLRWTQAETKLRHHSTLDPWNRNATNDPWYFFPENNKACLMRHLEGRFGDETGGRCDRCSPCLRNHKARGSVPPPHPPSLPPLPYIAPGCVDLVAARSIAPTQEDMYDDFNSEGAVYMAEAAFKRNRELMDDVRGLEELIQNLGCPSCFLNDPVVRYTDPDPPAHLAGSDCPTAGRNRSVRYPPRPHLTVLSFLTARISHRRNCYACGKVPHPEPTVSPSGCAVPPKASCHLLFPSFASSSFSESCFKCMLPISVHYQDLAGPPGLEMARDCPLASAHVVPLLCWWIRGQKNQRSLLFASVPGLEAAVNDSGFRGQYGNLRLFASWLTNLNTTYPVTNAVVLALAFFRLHTPTNHVE